MDEKKRPIDLNGRKLMIAIPAYDGRVNIKTAIALAQLSSETAKFGVTLYISHVSGCSLITKARNALVADFLETDADTLLFVDSDVIITADAVLRLLAISKGKDITAGVYPRRGADRMFFMDIHLTEDTNELVFDENGMLQIRRIGTGFMMIQRHVFETMIKNHPEWRYINDTKNRDEYALFDFGVYNGKYYGEDYLFCDRATAEGFTVFLDPSISLPHVGTQEFERNFEEEALKVLLKEYSTPKLKVANG
jgi:hypothetical protein